MWRVGVEGRAVGISVLRVLGPPEGDRVLRGRRIPINYPPLKRDTHCGVVTNFLFTNGRLRALESLSRNADIVSAFLTSRPPSCFTLRCASP